MTPPPTGMLFLPLPRPLGPQTQHMVGIQEAHPLWRAVFAVTGEEEIKGRELWDLYGEKPRVQGRTRYLGHLLGQRHVRLLLCHRARTSEWECREGKSLLEKGRVSWPYPACRKKYGKNVTLSVRHGGRGLPPQAWLEDRQHGSHPRPAEPGSGVQPGSQVCVLEAGELGSRAVLPK